MAAATVQLEARLVSGQPAWDWFRSDAAFILERQPGRDYPHTRVRVPEAVPGDGQPYLMRTFDVGEPLGGRIFRVLLDLRRAPVGADVTTPSEVVPSTSEILSGSPIGGRDCQGVLLQAWAERGWRALFAGHAYSYLAALQPFVARSGRGRRFGRADRFGGVRRGDLRCQARPVVYA